MVVMSLLDLIRDAGVVGAGGAGFPTHIKLNCNVEYLIVNGAECEPLLYTDKYIMNTHPDEILEAMESAGAAVSADKVIIAVKGVNKKEISSLKDAIKKRKSRVEIFQLDNYYPAGDEQMIVYDITGRIVPPGGIPINVGAVVSNTATMLNIYEAMAQKPVTHKILTVTGAVRHPMVLRVPIGVTFAQCIGACGGSELKEFKVIDGGPMMGSIVRDIYYTYVTKTTSGIIVIPDAGNFDSMLAGLSVKKILNRAKSACIQCSFCTDLCPRQLIGHPLRPHMVMRQMSAMDFSNKEVLTAAQKTFEETLICCECGVCEAYACPMNLSPRQVNKYIKSMIDDKRSTSQEPPFTAHIMREYRKIAPYKIMARMGLAGLYEKKLKGFLEIRANTVYIPVKQHIGAPAIPIVAINDRVTEGQMIARIVPPDNPGANVHASISGVVMECGEFIAIKGDV
jgi:Na+-translocating ferredoxin:NAD+ oxidoreductase RnfC subunit